MQSRCNPLKSMIFGMFVQDKMLASLSSLTSFLARTNKNLEGKTGTRAMALRQIRIRENLIKISLPQPAHCILTEVIPD